MNVEQQRILDMKEEKITPTSGYSKLDEWATIWRETLPKYFGYPFNEISPLRDFYEWYYAAGINLMNLNNAGDPFTDTPWEVSSQVLPVGTKRGCSLRWQAGPCGGDAALHGRGH